MQGVSALVRLAFGVMFAWLLLDAFGTATAGSFWAKAVAYQIAFTLCGFGLPYGVVQQQGRDFTFYNPEVRAVLVFILLTMVVLLFVLWMLLDRDLQGAAIGLHFLVNRLVFLVIFFRRSALEFKHALYQQLAYDTSVIAMLFAVWMTDASFASFTTLLMGVNFIWLTFLIWTTQLFKQSFVHMLALRRAFAQWRVFSARTYSTEVVGLVLNGLDRVVLAALGHEDFLAIYVLARKFYEVPHNIMTAQSSVVFAIMVKLWGDSPAAIESKVSSSSTQRGSGLVRTKLIVVLGYEGLAILAYGLMAVLLLWFGLIDRAGELGVSATGLVAFFLVIGIAQASLIPMLNLTYAQGNAHFILNYTLTNALIGCGLLLIAWIYDSTGLVVISQSVIVLTSWSFMALYVLREFGLRIGSAIALGKLTLLVVLLVWLVHASVFSTLFLP